MSYQHENDLNDIMMTLPRLRFGMISVIGAIAFFILGMRFAFRRGSIPLIAYRLLYMLRHR